MPALRRILRRIVAQEKARQRMIRKLAKEGDPTCLKIIWDRVIPGKRAIEEKDKSEDKLNISISIEGMDVEKAQSTFENDLIEADFTEIKKDNAPTT